MHGMHRSRASSGRVRPIGSGPSLRFDAPEDLLALTCAAASGVRARRVPAHWRGEASEGLHAGAEARDTGWAFHLDDETTAPAAATRLTRGPARWTAPGLRVEAAAGLGGFLVPASGMRLLQAADRRDVEGTREGA